MQGSVEKGIRGGQRRGRQGSEVDGGEEEGIGGRWKRGNEGSGGWRREREERHQM